MARILPFPGNGKLEELALYVLDKTGPLTWDELCWMLWRIDTEAFLRTGKSITRCRYYKQPDEVCGTKDSGEKK